MYSLVRTGGYLNGGRTPPAVTVGRVPFVIKNAFDFTASVCADCEQLRLAAVM